MRAFLVIVCSCVLCSLHSVSVIMKTNLAEKWFEVTGKYSPKEKQEFVLGTLIQTITFLDSIDPSYYDNGVTLKEIYESDSAFDAGYKFHSYVCEKKQKLVDRWGVFHLISGIAQDQMHLFFKLLEDEILFDTKHCAKAASYLSSITTGEILTGIEVEKLAIWHGVLYKYFASKPSESLISLKQDKRIQMPISSETLDIWKAALLFFSKNDKIKTYLKDFIAEFDTSFEFFKLKYLHEKKH